MYFANSGRGRPDLVVSNRHAFHTQNYILPGPILTSDHMPIIFTIFTNPTYIPFTLHKIYKPADKDTYKNTLSNITYEGGFHNNSVAHTENQRTHVINNIQNTLDISSSILSYSPGFSFIPPAHTKHLSTCCQHRFTHIFLRYNSNTYQHSTMLCMHLIHGLQQNHKTQWQTPCIHGLSTLVQRCESVLEGHLKTS